MNVSVNVGLNAMLKITKRDQRVATNSREIMNSKRRIDLSKQSIPPKPILCGVSGVNTPTIEACCTDVPEAQNDTRSVGGKCLDLAQMQAKYNTVY